ncbi:MAG: magnesium transporter [Bacillota bacterium]
MNVFNGAFKEITIFLQKNDKAKVREIFEEIHPYDQAQILMELKPFERKKLANFLSNEEMAEIIQQLDIEQQKQIIDELGIERYSQILVEMPSDDAADLLSELDEEQQQEVLELIDDQEAADMRELMEYPENTAGGIMTTEYIVLPQYFTADEAINKLRKIGPDAETVYYLYVTDEMDRLIGVLSLRDLIIANPQTKIQDIMYERVVSVPVTMDQEEVARIMEKYDFLAVPVVNKEKKLMGIITVDDAIDVLNDEASEDIARFGGIVGREPGVLDLKVNAFEAARKRIPWLILLLGVGVLAGNIIAQFEETLEAVVILAIFIPMIADMAGNTGTQSLAVVVRGLATGQFTKKDTFNLIKREAGVGLIIGITNGLLISIIAALWQKSIALGFVIGVSLWVTLFFATLAGTIIPLIMVRLKIDPAVASGPFITTVNDILGLTIYFTIATLFMSYLI